MNQNGDILVALTGSNQGIKAMLSVQYPNMRFATYESVQDCIDALHAGQVDAYGNALYELEYCLKSPRNEGLSIAYSYSCPIDYCLALKADAPNELMNILNSGIALIDMTDKEQIVRHYSTFTQYETSLSDTLYENRHILAGTGAVILFILIAWIGYYHIQKKAVSEIRRKEAAAHAAAEEARRANAAKTDFLARVSHNMRTPMNGILGCAALAKDSDDIERIHLDMTRIENEGQYLLGLINDMLDMSKIENGQLSLDLKPVDSRKVIDDTLRLIESYTKINDVELTLELHKLEQGMVRMDALRVQQILVNVITNAAKFSHKGGTVELYGECYEASPEKVRVKFVIKDHGIGISSDFLPLIFEPFSRENHAADGGCLEGSGLGLSITKKLVDMMGGHIEIESTPGVGTSVTILLDFERCTDTAMRTEADANKLALSGVRTLMCEDNELNTIVEKGILDKAGCIVECALDGKIGLDMFAASEVGYYDVILMDIQMPVMDGIEATQAIRALDRPDAKSIPIFALTANTFEDDVKAYLAAGMNDCIAKPVTKQLLVEVICKHL